MATVVEVLVVLVRVALVVVVEMEAVVVAYVCVCGAYSMGGEGGGDPSRGHCDGCGWFWF